MSNRPRSSASFRKPCRKSFGRNANAAFSLDWFNQDGGRLIVDLGRDGVEVAEGGIDKAWQKRADAFVVLWLGRGGDCCVGTTVKTALEGDDLVLCGRTVQAGQFDGGFVGFGSRIAEKRLAAKAPLAQQLGPLALGLHVPGIRHMDEFGDLLLNSFYHGRGTVAQQIAAPAGKEIEIAIPLVVPHMRTFASHQTTAEIVRSWGSRSHQTSCNVAGEIDVFSAMGTDISLVLREVA